ncbi:MAG: tRNA (adenosine(37)-N6)-dimethylallyltransferase MiaA [Acetanaerobacterium sp.]
MEKGKKPPLVVIVGPTASGKTALALSLARRMDGEIVSADSMQVYKGMDIQTAKPTPTELAEVPHHLIGVLKPHESFSVAKFQSLARSAIADIAARGRLPFLVGGTGLYVSAVVDNTDFGEIQIDPAVRARLVREAEEQGGETLLARLEALDPAIACRLHPNNTGRIIRALEVVESTGRTLSDYQEASRLAPPPYRVRMLGVTFRDRALLYERVNKRVDEMLQNGLLDEVRELLHVPLSPTARQAIGCKELRGYLDGTLPLAEAVENLKRQTRRYAKRQLTWFRRDERVRWLYHEDGDVVKQALERLEEYNADIEIPNKNISIIKPADEEGDEQ